MSQQPPQQPPRSPQQPPRSPVYEDAYEAYREGIRRFQRESQSPPQQQPQQHPEEDPEEHPEEDPEEDPEEHPEEIPEEISQPRQQRRRRKPRSEMWKYFTEINDDEGKKGRCNKCEKIINADSRHQGTSALHHHYRMCVLPGSSSSHTQVSRHDPQEYRKELVKYIVSTDQAFSHVESKGFGRFVHYLAPDIIEISRKALRSDIMKFFEQDKEELKALFMLRRFNVALTSDIWTGNAKMDYMSVVAHNIDEEWNLNKRIIAFKRIEGSHTADNILDILLSVIDEWNLRDRIISITLDNAANNNRMVRALRTRIPNQASILHQRCATHIINLIVKAAFTHFDVAITKIREAISWINSSNSRVDSLKRRFLFNGLEERTFHVDNNTRWNSTWLMLTTFLVPGYVDVATEFVRRQGGHDITAEDIAVAKCFCEFLHIFYDETCALSAVYTPTSYLALHTVTKIAAHLYEANHFEFFRPCINSMKEKFEKYWGIEKIPCLYGFACILDPRMKFGGYLTFLQYLKRMTGNDYVEHDHTRVVEEFYIFFRSYQRQIPTAPEPSPSRHVPSTSRGVFRDLARFVRGGSSSPSSSPHPEPATETSQHDEIVLYNTQQFASMGQEDLNLMTWWKQHENMFPILSKMARDVHSIPVSTVSSESAFSSSGRIIDDRRHSLKPEMVEALTIYKDWCQHEHRSQETFISLDEFDNFGVNLENMRI